MDKFTKPLTLEGKDEVTHPTNGTLTATEARAILEAEARQKQAETQERLRQYGEAMAKLSEQFHADLEQQLILPGGEAVGLSSWLRSIGASAMPRLNIVSK